MASLAPKPCQMDLSTRPKLLSELSDHRGKFSLKYHLLVKHMTNACRPDPSLLLQTTLYTVKMKLTGK